MLIITGDSSVPSDHDTPGVQMRRTEFLLHCRQASNSWRKRWINSARKPIRTCGQSVHLYATKPKHQRLSWHQSMPNQSRFGECLFRDQNCLRAAQFASVTQVKIRFQPLDETWLSLLVGCSGNLNMVENLYMALGCPSGGYANNRMPIVKMDVSPVKKVLNACTRLRKFEVEIFSRSEGWTDRTCFDMQLEEGLRQTTADAMGQQLKETSNRVNKHNFSLPVECLLIDETWTFSKLN